MAAVLPASSDASPAGPPVAEKPFKLLWEKVLYMCSDVLMVDYTLAQLEI